MSDVTLLSTHPYPRETHLKGAELIYDYESEEGIKLLECYLHNNRLYSFLKYSENLSFQIVSEIDLQSIEDNFYNQGAIDGPIPDEIREDLSNSLSTIS